MTLSLQDHKSEEALGQWFQHLNTVDAPAPRRHLQAALQFFAIHMPKLPPGMALNFLHAMDLSRPVRSARLAAPDELLAFRFPDESPYKLFYTRPGGSKHSSGISPDGRAPVRFAVRTPCQALESYTTGAIDVWSTPAPNATLYTVPRLVLAGTAPKDARGVMAMGGGIQLIVPNASDHLEVDSSAAAGR